VASIVHCGFEMHEGGRMHASKLIENLTASAVDRGLAYAKGVGAATAGRVALRVALRQPILTLVAAGAAAVWYLRKHKNEAQEGEPALSKTASPST
jgi:hypothetical protein